MEQDVRTETQKANNRGFIKETFEKLGMGDTFDKLADQKMKEGVKNFELGATVTGDNPNDGLKVNFRVKEQTPGFYILDGYQATLIKDGKEGRTQFFSIFKKSGFTVDQAKELLRGGSVLNKIKENGEVKERYTRLNFDQTTPKGNFKQKHTTDIEDYKPLIILGKVPMIASEQERKDMSVLLHKGEAVPVMLRNGERGHLQLNPEKKAIDFHDSKGEVTSFVQKKREIVPDLPDTTKNLVKKTGEVVKPEGGSKKKVA